MASVKFLNGVAKKFKDALLTGEEVDTLYDPDFASTPNSTISSYVSILRKQGYNIDQTGEFTYKLITMITKKEDTKEAFALTPSTVGNVQLGGYVSSYDGALRLITDLKQKLKTSKRELEQFLLKHIDCGIEGREINAALANRIKVFLPETASDEAKRLVSITGSNIVNMATNPQVMAILEKVANHSTIELFKEVLSLWDTRNNGKPVDEKATAKAREDYLVLYNEFAKTQDELEVAEEQLLNVKQSISFYKDIATINRVNK